MISVEYSALERECLAVEAISPVSSHASCREADRRGQVATVRGEGEGEGEAHNFHIYCINILTIRV